MADTILQLSDVKVSFRTLDGMVDAVKGVNLHVEAGETVAIVGEFGFGQEPADDGGHGPACLQRRGAGRGRLSRQESSGAPKAELNTIRGRKITMIFQEPMTSLDPLYTIGSQLMEPIMHHQKVGAGGPRRAPSKC